MKHILATLAVIVTGGVLGPVAACSLFNSVDKANNPQDDSNMRTCRLLAGTQFQFDPDAGAAWANYDACMRDGGYR